MTKTSLSSKEAEALRFIRNSIVHKGKSPSLREIMTELGYSSPRSASLLVASLIVNGFIKRKADDSLQIIKDLIYDPARAQTIEIPLIGAVACGTPILAEENIEAMVPISIHLAKPSHRYYLLRAKGDSMNLAGINDGNILLIQQQETAENGDKVVALIDNEATVKIFEQTDQAVILRPKSSNQMHKPIILTNDFKIQGLVKAVLPADLA